MKDKTNDFSFITQDLVLTDTMISLDESLEFQEQYPEILNYLSFGTYMFEQYRMVENLCEYVEMTRGERYKQLEQQKLDQQLELQKLIDNGEMLNVGSDSNPHW